MRDTLLKDCKEKMDKAISVYKDHLATLRSGRASTSALDDVKVEAYGQEMPLNQVATVTTPDGHTIMISPWDKTSIGPIEKAILAANLGFTPSNDGQVVRINIPPLTEETRKDIVKQAHHMAEEARVAVRNVRRHGNDEVKKAQKDSDISEDDSKGLLDDIQKMTDNHTKLIDDLLKEREKELMTV